MNLLRRIWPFSLIDELENEIAHLQRELRVSSRPLPDRGCNWLKQLHGDGMPVSTKCERCTNQGDYDYRSCPIVLSMAENRACTISSEP